ncbi:MAG: hypothetical protein ACFBZ8_10175 [Opitutales bacterium]
MVPEKIGFPPPLLGDQPWRLRVFDWQERLLALEKPVGVLVDPHPWYPKSPSLVAALAAQAEADKPELAGFEFGRVHGVGFLDAEIAGAALIAADKIAAAHWRDLAGSDQIEWTFEVIARPIAPPETALGKRGGTIESAEAFACELPLIGEDASAQTRVSHRFGKRSRTCFQRDPTFEAVADWQCWTARVRLNRPHQVRLHAFESGLRVAGEKLYLDEHEAIAAPKDTLPGPLVRLASISLPQAGARQRIIKIPPLDYWRRALRTLAKPRASAARLPKKSLQ